MKVLIYDLEIRNAILGKNDTRREDLTYCDGWDDHAGMGISVLCAWIGWEQRPLVFLSEDLIEFQRVADEADWCVGFNSISFDNKVLAANDVIISPDKVYDILDNFYQVTGRRASLGDICEANFGIPKSGNGADAPELWQRGRMIELINYCLHDTVALTRRLLEKIYRDGEIVHPYAPDAKVKIQFPKSK
jgi:hypothetical protein